MGNDAMHPHVVSGTWMNINTCFSCHIRSGLMYGALFFATGPQRNGRARMCQWPEQACGWWLRFTTLKDDYPSQVQSMSCRFAFIYLLMTHYSTKVNIELQLLGLSLDLRNGGQKYCLKLDTTLGMGGVATSIFNQPRGGRVLKSTDKSKMGDNTS